LRGGVESVIDDFHNEILARLKKEVIPGLAMALQVRALAPLLLRLDMIMASYLLELHCRLEINLI